MKKLLFPVIVLTLVLLMVIPAMAVVEEPEVFTSLDGPDPVSTDVVNVWTITIEFCSNDRGVDEVVVQGGIGADLVVTEVNGDVILLPLTKGEIFISGDVTLTKKGGKMGATIVTWNIGTLAVDTCLSLDLVVQTGKNPKNKQEFTSAELGHELIGGFSATYTYDDTEGETPETDPLLVDVVGVEEE